MASSGGWFRYIPHKQINAYIEQGWEVLPMLGHHAHYSHMAVLEW
jgi:hypothetical protein